MVLALLACAAVFWWRRRAGSQGGRRRVDAPVRRLGGARLSPRVALEVVEFGGQRILLSVSESGAREIARAGRCGRAGERAMKRVSLGRIVATLGLLVWLAPWQAMAAALPAPRRAWVIWRASTRPRPPARCASPSA
ncbi:hypothetical protein WJ968_20170 [Achromobacter xylosoxidans]